MTFSNSSSEASVEGEVDKENGPESRQWNGNHNWLSPAQQQGPRREPDVTIVVGGREFLHYSQVLCLASDYFDVALNIGMTESASMRIEFPHDDPCEWELFASFLDPFSQATVTKSNVTMLVPWFHKFGITDMLKKCDRIYCEQAAPPLQRRCWNLNGHASLPDAEVLRNKLHELLNAYAFSTMYDLPITKERATRSLRRQITCAPELFDQECTAALVSILQQEEARKDLWSPVKEYIPTELQNDEPESLVSNKLFPFLLLTWFQNQETSRDNGMYYA